MNYGENIAVLEDHEHENAKSALNRMLTSTTMPWNLNKLGSTKQTREVSKITCSLPRLWQVSAFRAPLPWIKL